MFLDNLNDHINVLAIHLHSDLLQLSFINSTNMYQKLPCSRNCFWVCINTTVNRADSSLLSWYITEATHTFLIAYIVIRVIKGKYSVLLNSVRMESPGKGRQAFLRKGCLSSVREQEGVSWVQRRENIPDRRTKCKCLKSRNS